MKVKDFNLKQTLECGQCFNFERIDSGDADNQYRYTVTAFGRWLDVIQTGDELEFINAEADEIRDIWVPYFDLERDYGKIKSAIIKAAPELEHVIEKYCGIRILNQEFIETLISFIISQNSNIPRIKKTVKAISETYGKKVEEFKGKNIYRFPDINELDKISEQDFRDLKTGFRAAYLRDAVDRLASGEIDGEKLSRMSFKEAKEKLLMIKGVGEKVANCVLLFGLGFRNAFPVDVWIKRIMEEMYFDKKPTDKKVIEAFAAEKFGEYGGYAQQYLFIFARERG